MSSRHILEWWDWRSTFSYQLHTLNCNWSLLHNMPWTSWSHQEEGHRSLVWESSSVPQDSAAFSDNLWWWLWGHKDSSCLSKFIHLLKAICIIYDSCKESKYTSELPSIALLKNCIMNFTINSIVKNRLKKIMLMMMLISNRQQEGDIYSWCLQSALW